MLLVQVDPDYEFSNVDRGRPYVSVFDNRFWQVPGVAPTNPVSGVVGRLVSHCRD